MSQDSIIPVKANNICVYICRRVEDRLEVLLVNGKTSSGLKIWAVNYTVVKGSQMCWETALDEVRIKTSHVPDRLYSLDKVEQNYDPKANCIQLAPLMVAFFDNGQETKPVFSNMETSWVDAYEAEKLLPLPRQREALKMIYHEYFLKEPSILMKLYPKG